MGGGAVKQPHHPAPEDPEDARLPYFFMGQDENKVLPMLGIKERQSKMKFAHLVSQ